MDFEPHVSRYFDPGAAEPVVAIHDYHVALRTGELEVVEAKYSKADLSAKEQERLELLDRLVLADGGRLTVVYRKDLERDGFILTVMLLRRFGSLRYQPAVLDRARLRLCRPTPLTLDEWRREASSAKVPVGVLYHLLYHQELPLRYVPVTSVELATCRV